MTLEILAAPEQQEIEQVGENASNEASQNERAGGRARRIESLGVQRGVTSVTCAQQEEYQGQRLQQDADEDGTIGDREEAFVLPGYCQYVKHQRRCDRGEDQKHQPTEIGDGDKQAHA